MADFNRPNIVLIVLDTVRAHDLSIYGYEHETMPTLAEFADDSILFTRAYSNAPWTLPAHASLFTGQLPSEHGCHGGSPNLRASEPTLAETLADHGYRTIAISNNIWVSDHFGVSDGFETFYKQWQFFPESRDVGHLAKENDGYAKLVQELLTGNPVVNFVNAFYGRYLYRRHDFGGQRTTEDALALLDETAEPVFLFINYMEAHAEYRTHGNIQRFLSDPVCANGFDEYTHLSARSKEFHEGTLTISDGDFEVMRALYNEELYYLDSQLETLFSGLSDRGMLEDSLVIVVSDHGENIGDHGLMAHRFSVHDTLLRVPLVIRYPEDWSIGVNRTNKVVDLRDIYEEVYRIGTADERPDSLLFERKTDDSVVVAEYLDTSLTPEANDETFAFEGSRFDKRLIAAINAEYKLVMDDRGNKRLYRLSGEGDFEIDGKKTPLESTVVKELERHCNDLAEVKSTRSKITESNVTVKRQLEDLGYL